MSDAFSPVSPRLTPSLPPGRLGGGGGEDSDSRAGHGRYASDTFNIYHHSFNGSVSELSPRGSGGGQHARGGSESSLAFAPLHSPPHSPHPRTQHTHKQASQEADTETEAAVHESSVSSVATASFSSSSVPSAVPAPLQLPAHVTTPSQGSSEQKLESQAGINSLKLSPLDFQFGKVLGEGSFAQVVECSLRSDPSQRFACKMVDKHFVTKMGKVNTVMQEKKVLTLLHGHVGIVQLFYTFQDNTSLFYVMELAPGGDMFSDLKRVGKYDLSLSRFYTAQLVEILAYMHNKGIVHRDLKPENILFTEKRHIKLTDFGTSRQLEADSSIDAKRRGSFVGTAEYVSPEVLGDKPASTAADLWSLGVILYQLLTGKVPFRGASEYLTFQKILNRDITWPEDMDEQARDLIEKLLVLEPEQRLGSTVEGYTALRAHPFFEPIDFETIFTQEPPPRPPPCEVSPDPPDVYHSDDESDDEWEQAGEEDEAEEGEDKDKVDSKLEQESSSSMAAGAADESHDAVMPLPSPPVAAPSSSPSRHCPRLSTDGQYTHSVWSRFLNRGESLLYTGLIIKRRGLFARKRQLLLTDAPRLFYVDPTTMELKKEVVWSPELWAEVRDATTFYIHTPNRDYYMRGLSSSAYCWVNEINNLQLSLKKQRESEQSADQAAD